ncbi:HIT family protein [Pseudarthrobacter sp. AB1]|uniref:HIT family protein n=1 Tax=Pseudarthrobacter sp. AB1 TaxID=2138309 RepID=UPI00186B5A1C|nr:HIT family protein [Pseudarthrobacter sp. AB1]MBE4718990.1 HIT family protein [Pseudarthrobacter sp. AB1]
MTESSLELPNDEPCAFCDYLSGKRAFTILCRTNLIAVLVTRDQRGVGHLLVIPTRHFPTLLEATGEERHALIDTVAAAAAAIDKAYERPGIAVWQNNGTAAHQAIAHLHFHVAGTLPGGGTNFGEVPELTVEQTDQIARHLAEAITSPICQP